MEATLASLSLREKAGQMVMAWIPGGAPRGAEQRRQQRLAAEEKVGGFLVATGGAARTAERLNELQASADVPLLIAADLEWGAGARLEGLTVLPMNMAIAAAGGARYAYEAGRITGTEARAAGVHMAFAPVADVNVNPLNPVINTRAYGADAEQVAERVAAFIEGARETGLLSVAKHFPGHGDTEVDSHLSMPSIFAPRERLEAVELVPFRAAVRSGVTGVMTAHLAVPALEPGGSARRPATLSESILTDLLRKELGFGGLIVTDALTMEGIREGRTPGEVAVEAVRAGADVLLQPVSERETIDALEMAVRAGRIRESRIDESVRRILHAKSAVGLDRDRLVDLGRLEVQIAEAGSRFWAESAVARSLTLVLDGALPIRVEGRSVVHVAYDDARRRQLGEAFEEVLAGRGASVRQVRLSSGSDARQIESAESLASRADVVIFSSYARALPSKGDIGLPPQVALLANRLAARGALVISFGDPYFIRQLPAAGTYLLAWSDVAERSAARALLGEVPITGRLPIALPPLFQVGDGLDRMLTVTEAAQAEGPTSP